MAKRAKKGSLARVRQLLGETGKVELHGLRLVESSSKLGELRENDELPGQAMQAISLTLGLSDDQKAAKVTVRIKLDATYDGDATKEPVLSILASFELYFDIVEAFRTPKVREAFFQRIGMLVVWPYWREFVQTMTTRMGLPAFPVPIARADKIFGDSNDD